MSSKAGKAAIVELRATSRATQARHGEGVADPRARVQPRPHHPRSCALRARPHTPARPPPRTTHVPALSDTGSERDEHTPPTRSCRLHLYAPPRRAPRRTGRARPRQATQRVEPRAAVLYAVTMAGASGFASRSGTPTPRVGAAPPAAEKDRHASGGKTPHAVLEVLRRLSPPSEAKRRRTDTAAARGAAPSVLKSHRGAPLVPRSRGAAASAPKSERRRATRTRATTMAAGTAAPLHCTTTTTVATTTTAAAAATTTTTTTATKRRRQRRRRR